MLGKIENGVFKRAPKKVNYNGKTIFNPSDEILLELGYEDIDLPQKTPEEIEAEYWQNTPYDVLVDNEIRKKYSISQEFAILRQKDEKPTEYAEYYAYCEQCKADVKEKLNSD